MFENDLFSSSVSASNAVLWLLAALATPGMMFSVSQYYFYAHARTFTPEAQDRILFVSQVFHVGFVMAIAGLVTMLVWTSLAPDRRDSLVLGPLPVTAGEQARAKLIALLRFFSMFAVAVTVPTAFAFTFVTVGDAPLLVVAARIAGHIAAALLGAGFVFFSLVDAQLVLAALIGPRAVAMATWPLQAAAVLAMVAAVSMTGRLADAMLEANASVSAAVMWNPAAWFVGVYRWIAGEPREVFGMLAGRGVYASVAVMVAAWLAYPAAYTRCLQRAIATEGKRAAWWSGAVARGWLRLMSPLLRAPLERGIAAFIVANLTRSHTHRFLIGSYIGIGLLFALPLGGRLLAPGDSAAIHYAWFSVPLSVLCWLAAGLRVAMMLPVEPASNWLFKLTEPVDRARVISAVVKVMHGASVAPLTIGFGAAATLARGPAFGATVATIVLLTGGALIELLTLTLRTVPGTCTYRPGQLRLRALWPVYLTVWITIAYVLPRFALAGLSNLQVLVTIIAALSSLWAALHAWRVLRARKLTRLVYEELDPVLTTTIDLSSARA